MTGCAMSVKWSALWYVILFVIADRLLGDRRPPQRRRAATRGATRCSTRPAGWSLFGVHHRRRLPGQLDRLVRRPTTATTGTGSRRTTATRYRRSSARCVNLCHYHHDALHFHDTLTTPHIYQSWPWQWLLLGRPVAFYYSAAGGCGARELLGRGAAARHAAAVVVVPAGAGRHRPRSASPGATGGRWPSSAARSSASCRGSSYEFSHRTMFYFYAVPAAAVPDHGGRLPVRPADQRAAGRE